MSKRSIFKVVFPHPVLYDFFSSLSEDRSKVYSHPSQVHLGEPVSVLGLPAGAPVTRSIPNGPNHHGDRLKSWSIFPGRWAAPPSLFTDLCKLWKGLGTCNLESFLSLRPPPALGESFSVGCFTSGGISKTAFVFTETTTVYGL